MKPGDLTATMDKVSTTPRMLSLLEITAIATTEETEDTEATATTLDPEDTTPAQVDTTPAQEDTTPAQEDTTPAQVDTDLAQEGTTLERIAPANTVKVTTAQMEAIVPDQVMTRASTAPTMDLLNLEQEATERAVTTALTNHALISPNTEATDETFN